MASPRAAGRGLSRVPADLDYPINLDLGELLPGCRVVARGARLDGSALTLYFEVRACPNRCPDGGLPCAPFACWCRTRGPLDDGFVDDDRVDRVDVDRVDVDRVDVDRVDVDLAENEPLGDGSADGSADVSPADREWNEPAADPDGRRCGRPEGWCEAVSEDGPEEYIPDVPVEEQYGWSARRTFPPPMDARSSIRFDIRPLDEHRRTCPGGGLLCLDLGTGAAVYLPGVHGAGVWDAT